MIEDFRECAACAAKPGSPVLCDACLHNQKLVADYRRERTAVVDLVRQMRAVVERAVAERMGRSHEEDPEADNLQRISFLAEAFVNGYSKPTPTDTLPRSLSLSEKDEEWLRGWARKDPDELHAVKSIKMLLDEVDVLRAALTRVVTR